MIDSNNIISRKEAPPTHKIKNVFGIKRKIIRAITNPYWLLGYCFRKVSRFIKNDEIFIKWEFLSGMHRFPELQNPRTFNDKLQWLKLHNKRPEYTEMVDKAGAKDYVSRVLGTDEYNIPTLGVWDKVEDIDFDALPQQFVLKCTHDSGGIVVCKDKSKLDIKASKAKLSKALKSEYFLEHREYPYKDVKPRIIGEQYMVDESGTELKDYKIFCFNGEPKMLFVATDRPHDVHFTFFDLDWNVLPFAQGHPISEKPIARPRGLETMIELAKKLSKGIPHVRVDFYDINGKVYFGELTFFHFSGNVPFVPNEWDEKIGNWLILPPQS